MRLPVFAIVFAVIGMTAAAAQAQVMKESDCQLQYLRNVHSKQAVDLINGACNFLSTWSASMELSRNERLYNECLLNNLPGAANDHAAALLAQACRKQNSFSLQ